MQGHQRTSLNLAAFFIERVTFFEGRTNFSERRRGGVREIPQLRLKEKRGCFEMSFSATEPQKKITSHNGRKFFGEDHQLFVVPVLVLSSSETSTFLTKAHLHPRTPSQLPS